MKIDQGPGGGGGGGGVGFGGRILSKSNTRNFNLEFLLNQIR